MEKYEKGEVLGEGTYGSVFKGVCKATGRVVALKKIRMAYSNDKMSAAAEREVAMLKRMASEHVVTLLDVFPHKKNLYLVFEYLETDLEAIVKCKGLKLQPSDIKALLHMMLQGLAHLHKHNIVHRDIKPDNMLVSTSGHLKLADFGLARGLDNPADKRTNQVFMRWYRAPEILYGSTSYGPAADIWAAGCVFAELILRVPWFPGSSDIDQLSKIFTALGQPKPEEWRGLRDLPTYMEFRLEPPPPLEEQFPGVSEDALDLLSQMVKCDPEARISAEAALKHRYFTCQPAPTPAESLPRPSTCPPRHTTLKSASNLLNQALNNSGLVGPRPILMGPSLAHVGGASLMKPPPNRKRASEASGLQLGGGEWGQQEAVSCMSGMTSAPPASKRSRTQLAADVTGGPCAMSISSDARCLWPDMSPATCLPMSLDPSTLMSSQDHPLCRPRLNTRELHYLRQRTCELGQLLGIAAQEEQEAAGQPTHEPLQPHHQHLQLQGQAEAHSPPDTPASTASSSGNSSPAADATPASLAVLGDGCADSSPPPPLPLPLLPHPVGPAAPPMVPPPPLVLPPSAQAAS